MDWQIFKCILLFLVVVGGTTPKLCCFSDWILKVPELWPRWPTSTAWWALSTSPLCGSGLKLITWDCLFSFECDITFSSLCTVVKGLGFWLVVSHNGGFWCFWKRDWPDTDGCDWSNPVCCLIEPGSWDWPGAESCDKLSSDDCDWSGLGSCGWPWPTRVDVAEPGNFDWLGKTCFDWPAGISCDLLLLSSSLFPLNVSSEFCAGKPKWEHGQKRSADLDEDKVAKRNKN